MSRNAWFEDFQKNVSDLIARSPAADIERNVNARSSVPTILKSNCSRSSNASTRWKTIAADFPIEGDFRRRWSHGGSRGPAALSRH